MKDRYINRNLNFYKMEEFTRLRKRYADPGRLVERMVTKRAAIEYIALKQINHEVETANRLGREYRRFFGKPHYI